MKFLRTAFLSLLMLAAPAVFAQNPTQHNSTGNITATASSCTLANSSSCVVLPLPNANLSSAVFTVSGSWSGTLNFIATNAGLPFSQALSVTPTGGGSAVTSASSNGSWSACVNAQTIIGIYASSISGAAIVTITSSTSAVTCASGGSGTVSPGTANQIAIYSVTGSTVSGSSSIPSGVTIPPSAAYGEINAAASPYNVVGDGGVSGKATITINSNIVTCSDCSFQSATTPAKVGMAVRGFTCVGCSNGTQIIPNGTTISSVDSGTQIHMSANATASSVAASGSLEWGTDWTTALTSAFAAEHALPRCGTFRFPTGYILFQTSAYGAQSSACNLGSNVDGSGEDIGGQGKDTTYLVILPDSGNTTFISNSGTNGPVHLHDVHFYGGGWSAYNAHLVNLGQDSTLTNVKFSSMGAANNNQGTLFMGSGSSGWAKCDNCYFEYTGGPEYAGVNVTIINNFWNTQLRIDSSGTEVNDYGSVPGQGQGGFNGLIDNTHGGIYRAFGVTAAGANNIVTLRVGNGSTTYLNNSSIGTNVSGAYGIFFDSGGSTVYSSGNSMIAGGTNGALNNTNNNAGSVFNDDGTTIFSGSISIFLNAANSTYNMPRNVHGACTGVATSSQTLGLYGTGPNETTTACTSTTIGSGIVATTSGTLTSLVATATAAGTSASSGVVTVLKNGSTTAITCTIGTGTRCDDAAHTASYVAGDLISIQFTTQSTETLAGVKATAWPLF